MDRTPEGLRLECLKLAATGRSTVYGDVVVEEAEKLLTFVLGPAEKAQAEPKSAGGHLNPLMAGFAYQEPKLGSASAQQAEPALSEPTRAAILRERDRLLGIKRKALSEAGDFAIRGEDFANQEAHHRQVAHDCEIKLFQLASDLNISFATGA